MKRKIKKTSSRGSGFQIFALILIIALFAGWKIYSCLYEITPQFFFLSITKDGIPLKILNGETLQLHPDNYLKIEEISTNTCFNYGIRLVTEYMDINAFRYEEIQIRKMLPEGKALEKYNLKLAVKYHNQEIGHVILIIEPFIEDWIDKADRSIGSERKAEVLEKALDFVPDDKRIKERLIREYKNLGRWKDVALLLDEKAQKTDNLDVYYELLEAYEAIHSTDDVIRVLKKMIELKPDNRDLYLRLAAILEETNRQEETIQAYEALLERTTKTERAPIYKTLGFLCSENNKLEKAISYYLEAVKLDKEDVNLYYNLSTLYEKTGQKDRSDEFLKKALELKSGDINGRMKLAESLINQNRLEDAEKYLKDVLVLDSKSMNALLLLLKIAEEQDDKEKQKEIYIRILSLEPENRTVIHNLGILEYETGNLEKALPYFEKLAETAPEDKELHTLLYDIYQKLNKEDLAYKEARLIISLGVNDMIYYRFISEYLNGKANYDELIKIINYALTVYPQDINLREYLVLAYLNKGKEDLAIGQLKEIARINPTDISVLLRLARLLDKQDRFEEALEYYKNILDISPDHEEAREAYIRNLMRHARLLEEEEKYEEALEAYKKIIDLSPGLSEAEESYLRLRFKVLPGED